jgi:ElaB/YqjD/DUF883 family membrane-anchored ribosome-binding protein
MVTRQKTTERIKEKAHEAVDEAARHGTTERVTEAAHEALDRAAEKSAEFEDQLRQRSQQAADQTREYTDALSQYVRENPLASLGMALAAGFVLASLTRK